jgi:hypothetical protein
MNKITRNPSAGGAGARIADHIFSLIASENNSFPADLQAFCISRRPAILFAIDANNSQRSFDEVGL